MSNRLYNIFLFIGSIFFIYFFISSTNPKTIDNTKTAIKSPLAPEIPENQKKEIESRENFLERKVAGIMASFAETSQGKQFLSTIIKPADPTIASENTNVVQLPKGFGQYEILTYGSGKKPECGDKIKLYDVKNKKYYDYILGNNKFKPNYDSIISIMSLGEIRKVMKSGEEDFTIKLTDIISNNEKPIIRFHQKPVAAKLACGASVIINFNIKTSDNKYVFVMEDFIKSNNNSITHNQLTLDLTPSSLNTKILRSLIDGGVNNVSYLILKREEILPLLKIHPFNMVKSLPVDDFYALEYTVLGYKDQVEN
ncbi:MAG: hypothetical protein J0G32_05465 [Alphaproteobacteria bacterium]|nr:hypothetical protein [Alphaproteobacteria bacterium]OJV13898.1 MAG: hypothetical protein BGO27_08390 [Alphaproteobacteria bacterium 33-17]